MNQIKLKDLAKELNLSPSTISRALSNHPAISKATKARVRKLAAELQYHPNLLAQGLQKKRIKVAGVLVPEIRHDFFSGAISGIEEIMYDEGFTIMVCQSSEDNIREARNLKALFSHQLAGIIISVSEKTTNSAPFFTVLDRGIPLVFFDRVMEDVEASRVVVDDFDGAVQVVEHLIESGYKKIAYIGGPKHLSINKNRFLGYKTVLEKNQIPLRDEWIFTAGLNEKDGVSAANTLLNSDLPRAIFCINDPVALGVYSVLQEKGLRIPQDVAVIGFSDAPIGRLINPPLSTVSQPAVEMGKTAARLLLEQISNTDKEFVPKEVILKTKLIIRRST